MAGMYMYVCLCSRHIYVCFCMYAYVCMHISVYVYVCMHAYVCIEICIYIVDMITLDMIILYVSICPV